MGGDNREVQVNSYDYYNLHYQIMYITRVTKNSK